MAQDKKNSFELNFHLVGLKIIFIFAPFIVILNFMNHLPHFHLIKFYYFPHPNFIFCHPKLINFITANLKSDSHSRSIIKITLDKFIILKLHSDFNLYFINFIIAIRLAEQNLLLFLAFASNLFIIILTIITIKYLATTIIAKIHFIPKSKYFQLQQCQNCNLLKVKLN